MKYIACTFIWLLATMAANAATWPTNGSAADVQAKINAPTTVTGDTVTIPPGTFLWTTTVTIPATKGITLQGATTSTATQGAGTTNTIIQRNSIVSGFDSLQVTIGTTNPGTRITGIRFEDVGTGGWPQGDNSFIQFAGGPVGTTLFRVDNCYFKNLVEGPMHAISIGGQTPGLFDHCTFEVSSSNKEIIQNGGRIPFGATQVLSPGWDDPINQAVSLFIEDCKFLNFGPRASLNSSIQQYRGARVTVRHNYFLDVCIDVHGTPDNGGGRWWEIYENDFDHTPGQSFDRYIQIRAGSGVMYNNRRLVAPGSGYNGGIVIWEEDGPADTPGPFTHANPQTYQLGYGANMQPDPAYFWNNWSNPGINTAGPNGTEPGVILLGRDYFNAVKTSGVGSTPYQYPHPLQGAVVVPTAPALSSMSPSSTIAGTGAFTLNLTGLRFVSGAIVKWNGLNRTTTFTSATQLSAAITANDVLGAGTASITVQNPNGETSNALTFTISTPTPLGTLYVDKDGGGIDSASQPGTQAAPFASIPYAVSRMVSGDEILVKQSATPYTAPSGIFITVSGQSGNPCAIRAFPGHTPQLVGQPPASVIVMTGVNWWEIEGMDISNGDFILWIRNNSNNITIRNNVIHDSTAQLVYVSNVCSNLLFDENNLMDGGSLGAQNGEGFYIGSAAAGDTTNNVIVRNNAITNMKHEAIEFKPNTNSCLAEGNVITDAIENFDFGIWAVSAHPGTTGTNPNHIIRNNIVSGVGDAGITQQPGAAFLAGTGVQIYNNVIFNTDSDGDGIHTRGIQFEGTGDTGFTRYFWNNTYTGPSASAIYVKSGTNNSIGNNIGPPTSQATNNLPYNAAYFVNAVGNDYHLVAGSAPVNAGTTPPFTIGTDFDGNPRVAQPDIGAYESTAVIPVVNTPGFSVAAGPYFSAQSVAITSSTSGATIRYTIDGTTPTSTTGTIYTTPITISATTTLKAIAYKSGSTDSAANTALYEIGTWSNTAGGTWKNLVIPTQTGQFTWTFRAAVSLAAANATLGLSPNVSIGVTDLEPIFFFSDANRIQARNDATYTSVTSFPYLPNIVYEFVVTVNVTTNTYSATVSTIGGTPVVIATDYAFRGGNGTATELDNVGISVPQFGMLSISQMSFTPVSPPVTVPTLTSATINAAGTTLTLAYSVPTSYGGGSTGGWTINASGGAATLTPGANPTTFTISRVIAAGETGTISYVQPGNGVEAATGGGDLASLSGFAFSNQSTVDQTAPSPNPSTFSSPPNAISSFAISMTATTATDAGGTVQYYFDETSANPGGQDSGWQSSPTYTDTDLSPGIQYTYRVLTRDPALNQTTPSSSVDVTTPIIAGARLITPTKQVGAGFFNP